MVMFPRAMVKQGQDVGTEGLFALSGKAQKEIIKLFLSTRVEMEGKRINEIFSEDFFRSHFWLYRRTMFALDI